MKAIILSLMLMAACTIFSSGSFLANDFSTKCLLGAGAVAYGVLGCWIILSELKSYVSKND